MSTFSSVNPASGEVVARYEQAQPAELETILNAMQAAFEDWRRADFATRAKPMRQAARLLRERQAALAHLMAVEMGKPLAQGGSELEKCAWACEFYADNAAKFLAPEEI